MSIDKFNSEGYYDPTAYEAMSAIAQEERALRAFRPIVYICSPFAGDTDRNIEAARKYSRYAVGAGYIPIAPHLLFPQFMNDADPKERELGLFFGNALMSNQWLPCRHCRSGIHYHYIIRGVPVCGRKLLLLLQPLLFRHDLLSCIQRQKQLRSDIEGVRSELRRAL